MLQSQRQQQQKSDYLSATATLRSHQLYIVLWGSIEKFIPLFFLLSVAKNSLSLLVCVLRSIRELLFFCLFIKVVIELYLSVSLYLLRVQFCACEYISLFNKTDLFLISNNCKCFPNIHLFLFRTSGSFLYEHPLKLSRFITQKCESLLFRTPVKIFYEHPFFCR